MKGHVYFLKPRFKDGPFKIGVTMGDVEQRLSNLQTGHYEALEVLAVVETDEPRKFEQDLHRRFLEYRIRGEWFAAHRSIYEFMLGLEGVYSPLGRWTSHGRSKEQWSLRDLSALPARRWY